MESLTIRFRLFGIPTTITPTSWLVLALLGGAFTMTSIEGMQQVLLFIVAGMISILCHEFGHALTSRKLAGATPEVMISGFSGYATNEGGRFTRWSYFATVAAGPTAGLIPMVFAVLALSLASGSLPATLDFLWVVFYSLFAEPSEAMNEVVMNYLPLLFENNGWMNFWVLDFFNKLIVIGCVWTMLNLLPIYPLDGNKMLGTLLNSDYYAASVGVVVTIPLFIWAAQSQLYFTMLIVLFLGYTNYQFYMALRRMRA